MLVHDTGFRSSNPISLRFPWTNAYLGTQTVDQNENRREEHVFDMNTERQSRKGSYRRGQYKEDQPREAHDT